MFSILSCFPLSSMFSILSCFPPVSLTPHTTLLSDTRLAYLIVFFPLVFFQSSDHLSLTSLSRLSPLSSLYRPNHRSSFSSFAGSNPKHFFFSCTNCSIAYLFICFHVSPAGLFHPPPHPYLKNLQS